MDYSSLPPEVHQQLADLELELKEGDITQKGYEKKRTKILQPFQQSGSSAHSDSSHVMSPDSRGASPPATSFQQELARTASARAQHVKDALLRHQPNSVEMPMPSKRTSYLKLPLPPVIPPQQPPQPQLHYPLSHQTRQVPVQAASSPGHHTPNHQVGNSPKLPRARLSPEQGFSPHPPAASSPKPAKKVASLRVRQQSEEEEVMMQGGQSKVSSKIQQLLNTLRRPKKKKNKEDYYTEDALEPIQEDPNAPKPVGPVIEPAAGEALQVDPNLPRNLEAAIARLGSVNHKAPCISTVDMHGKPQLSITYGKLSTRSQKICYSLLNRLGTKNEPAVRQGGRVALIYSAHDPAGLCAGFFGCIFAGVVPVAIEPPTSKEDVNVQQIGFLLGSLGISVALTSEITMKQLPKDESKDHVVHFKGWPKLIWFVTEHLPRPSKDWSPPPRPSADTPAYIEYVEDKDGSMMGVTVSRASLLCHCKTLHSACHYRDGESLVAAVSCHGDIGLWHGILTGVYAGMHVVFVPPAVLTVHPLSWVHMVTKLKATTAVVNSRALMLACGRPAKEYKDDSFATLRIMLVADGASPWSLHACDTFLEIFKPKGISKEVVCPCASSAETLTIGLRRPGYHGSTATGRGIMSITGLSYGVVRVEEENSMSSLTLQDCGTVLPGAKVAVVKLEGPPYLCQTDEVGEVCVSSQYTGTGYWGLAGKSTNTFKVQPLLPSGKPQSMSLYVRTGLLGFLGPGGLIFICGRLDGLMKVQGRRHNTDDLIATVLAVEPHKFVYRQRIAVFSVTVLRDERIVIVAEQRPGCSEDEAFQWMSNVLPAVETIHSVHVYALVLMVPNAMPMSHHNTPNVLECKQRFIDGSLHPVNLLMSPHQAITNLPPPRSRENIGSAAQMIGDIVTGVKPATAEGKRMERAIDERDGAGKYQFLSEVLRWRAQTTPDHTLFSLLNDKGVARTVTCSQLLKRAERVGCFCLEKANLSSGDHVTLLYPSGIELIIAFYGCLLVGLVPVPVRPPAPANISTTLPTVKMIVEVSKSVAILTVQSITKLLKTKEAASALDVRSLPPIVVTEDPPKRKLDKLYRAPTPEMMAYVDFSVSTTGVLSGVKMSHTSAANLCRSLKMTSELYPSRTVCLCLEPYNGLGFVLWCLSSVYAGHHSILIPPSELEINPALWLTAVSQNKVRDTFCSYSVVNLCTQELGGQTSALQSKGINLGCVRTCVIVAEERPRVILTSAFTALFAPLNLSGRAVSTTFGCRVNFVICSQGSSQPEPTTVYVDVRALRIDRVSLVEKGAPHSVGLLECGKMLPGVKVAIVNPDSRVLCHSTDLGEIWVSSPHNGSGYYGLSPDINDSLTKDHFAARLPDGSAYARTGYLGFIKHSDKPAADGGCSDSLFVVGSLDEAITMRSMRYYPIDIETSVVRCHKTICGCAVFTWSKLLVVVVEFSVEENEALDVVPIVTSAVLEEHQLIVGIVVVVDPGTIPINSRGERQRMHLRDGFLADELDPIYVAYNM